MNNVRFFANNQTIENAPASYLNRTPFELDSYGDSASVVPIPGQPFYLERSVVVILLHFPKLVSIQFQDNQDGMSPTGILPIPTSLTRQLALSFGENVM